MSHSITNRVRLTGKLIKGDRRFVLQCDDATVWKLDFNDLDMPKNYDGVIIEGLKPGIDTVNVDWIGPKSIG